MAHWILFSTKKEGMGNQRNKENIRQAESKNNKMTDKLYIISNYTEHKWAKDFNLKTGLA